MTPSSPSPRPPRRIKTDLIPTSNGSPTFSRPSTSKANDLSSTGRSGSRLQQQSPRYRTADQSVPDSPRSLDGSRTRIASASHSPLRLSRRYLQTTNPSSPNTLLNAASYDSDDSIRIERSQHGAILQDIVGVKAMLLKLKRVLQEQPDEDLLMRSETLNPFDSPLKNGHFNNNNGNATSLQQLLMDNQMVGAEDRFELADLRRQVLFLQAQLEDRERTVQQLRQQVVEVTSSNSAPTSICESTAEMCNAATQTERIRPMSAGPSLLQGFPMVDSQAKPHGPLVSLNNSSSQLKKQERHMVQKKQPSLVEYHPSNLVGSSPINLLHVYNHKTELSIPSIHPHHPNRSKSISPSSLSGIPTRRSLSQSRIRISGTQYL